MYELNKPYVLCVGLGTKLYGRGMGLISTLSPGTILVLVHKSIAKSNKLTLLRNYLISANIASIRG